jgi:hypothetical protein
VGVGHLLFNLFVNIRAIRGKLFKGFSAVWTGGFFYASMLLLQREKYAADRIRPACRGIERKNPRNMEASLKTLRLPSASPR